MKTGDKYKHFKHGTIYEVVGFSKDSETGETRVEYFPHEEIERVRNMPWSRPLRMFDELVMNENGETVKRFELIVTES